MHTGNPTSDSDPGQPWLVSDDPALGRFADEVARLAHVVRRPAADFEATLRGGEFGGVIDAALAPWAADRLTAAIERAVPQVVLPGGLDAGADRAAMDRFGKEVALKTSAARAPVTVLIPTEVWTAGRPLDPGLRDVFRASLVHWAAPSVRVADVEGGIDGDAAATAAVAELRRLTAISSRTSWRC
jgi:hypothetical protein